MFGHQAPRRETARPSLPRARRRTRSHQRLALFAALVALIALGLAAFTAGCGSAQETQATQPPAAVTTTVAAETTTTAAPVAQAFPVTVVDAHQTAVEIKAKPMRIVSTAPSNTEMLFALGLGDRIVGVSSMDDYPPEVAAVAKVGDFQVNTEAVIALDPDLVVGIFGAEEALKPVQDAGAAVIILDSPDLYGIYSNILLLGTATGTSAEATELVESLKAQIEVLSRMAAATGRSPRVFYAVDNTLWTAGPGSFVDHLLSLAHATNVAAAPDAVGPAAQAYYQFAPEQLVAADPDIILLPGTAYADVEEFTGDPRFSSLRAVTEGRVYLINDVVVTRPGPRIGDGLRTLVEAIHPGAL